MGAVYILLNELSDLNMVPLILCEIALIFRHSSAPSQMNKDKRYSIRGSLYPLFPEPVLHPKLTKPGKSHT
jgi:hypothetical protein